MAAELGDETRLKARNASAGATGCRRVEAMRFATIPVFST
jgi:hypothetical protein